MISPWKSADKRSKRGSGSIMYKGSMPRMMSEGLYPVSSSKSLFHYGTWMALGFRILHRAR
jgi:hypothetical protein